MLSLLLKKTKHLSMAVFRQSPKCLDCGKPYNAIYRKMPKDFVGDNFVQWDFENHQCENEVEYEYEMKFNSSPNDLIKIDGWNKININYLKFPDKLDEYIEKGIVRKVVKNRKPETPAAKLRNKLSPLYGLATMILMMKDNKELEKLVFEQAELAVDTMPTIDNLLTTIDQLQCG